MSNKRIGSYFKKKHSFQNNASSSFIGTSTINLADDVSGSQSFRNVEQNLGCPSQTNGLAIYFQMLYLYF